MKPDVVRSGPLVHVPAQSAYGVSQVRAATTHDIEQAAHMPAAARLPKEVYKFDGKKDKSSISDELWNDLVKKNPSFPNQGMWRARVS